MSIVASFKWTIEPGAYAAKLGEHYRLIVFQGAQRVAENLAGQIPDWMRENAPWTDRTGLARASLQARIESVELASITIIVEGTAPYQIWLELKNGGRFAIIGRTVDYWAQVFMRDVQAMLR